MWVEYNNVMDVYVGDLLLHKDGRKLYCLEDTKFEEVSILTDLGFIEKESISVLWISL